MSSRREEPWTHDPHKNARTNEAHAMSVDEAPGAARSEGDDVELVGEKIVRLHQELRSRFCELSRMAVAIYDRETDLLKTFIDSTEQHEPIRYYSIALSQVPSLKELARRKQHRIIDDLQTLQGSPSHHTQWLLKEGFRSSYTLPLFADEVLIGFLFFDADQPKYFDQTVIKAMSLYADLITSVMVNELAPIYTLRGALHATQRLTHHRDVETARHIFRMSHYAHLIAQKLSMEKSLGDEYAEYVLQYAPVHDVGKIGIPDAILLKPGKLDLDEYEVIKTHVQIGLDVIDVLIQEFDLKGFNHLSILRNIINCHHERYDGSGYPLGLKGEDIPLEGRIVAVADVLDALSNARPYKKAHSFHDSVAYVLEHSGTLFDPECCNALEHHIDEFEAIYEMFKD